MKVLDLLGDFGWGYLKPYSRRLLLGLLCGFLYAGANVLLALGMQFMTECVLPQEAAKPAVERVQESKSLKPAFVKKIESQLQETGTYLKEEFKHYLPAWGQENTLSQIVAGILFIPALVLLRGFFDFGNGYSMKWVAERFINDLRQGILVKLQSLSLDYFSRAKTSDLIERINMDSKVLYTSIQILLSEAIKESINLVVLFSMLIILDPKLTLLVAIFMPMCLLPTIVLGRKVKRAKKQIRKAMVAQGGVILESIANIRVVKAFHLEEQQKQEFRVHTRKAISNNMKAHRAEQLMSPLVEVIFALGLSALVFYIIGSRVNVPDFARFAMTLGLAYGSIKKLGIAHLRLQAGQVSLNRLQNTMDSVPSVVEKSGAQKVCTLGSGIRFESVSFAYADTPVLKNISFEIRPGERIGLAGPSGGGKSTIINLFLRFYDPTDGLIRWDGKDLKELEIASFRSQIAFVSQEVILFDKTVAENIAMGKPGATRAEVEEAARLAHAHDFIVALPQGYDTPIGERGSSLSGGQRQRLSIARAFIRNAPVLLLDEPTAALDSQSEKEVQAGLDQLTANRTVLCIAHRLSTLRQYDRIFVVEDGRMVEEGSFEALVAKDGLFASMAQAQGIAGQGAGSS